MDPTSSVRVGGLPPAVAAAGAAVSLTPVPLGTTPAMTISNNATASSSNDAHTTVDGAKSTGGMSSARRVRFQGMGGDSTPSPSLSTLHDDSPAGSGMLPSRSLLSLPPSSHAVSSAVRIAPIVDLTEFAAPEVVEDSDRERDESVSRSHRSSRSRSVSAAAADYGSAEASPPQLRRGAGTSGSATVHLATLKNASPAAPGGRGLSPYPPTEAQSHFADAPGKHVNYALPMPPSAVAGVRFARHERDDSWGSNSNQQLGVPYAHQRTPSPQLASQPSTVVSFSHRAKGSSALFAPSQRTRTRSTSFGGLGSPALGGASTAAAASSSMAANSSVVQASPSDYRHHALANNAHYVEPKRSTHSQQQSFHPLANSPQLATPAQMLALQLASSGNNPNADRWRIYNGQQPLHSSRSSSGQHDPVGTPQSAFSDETLDGGGGGRGGGSSGVPNTSGLLSVLGSPVGATGGYRSSSPHPSSSSSDSLALPPVRSSLSSLRSDAGIGGHVHVHPGYASARRGQHHSLDYDTGGGGSGHHDAALSFDVDASDDRSELVDHDGHGEEDRSGQQRGGRFRLASAAGEEGGPNVGSSGAPRPCAGVDPTFLGRHRSANELPGPATGLAPLIDNTLPIYTRVLRVFLIVVGVVRYMSPEQSKLAAAAINYRWESQAAVNGNGTAARGVTGGAGVTGTDGHSSSSSPSSGPMRLRRINVSSPAQAVRGGNEEEADGEIEIEIEEDEEEEANATEEAAAGGHNTRRNRNTATVNGGGTAPPVPLQHSSSDVQRPTFGPPSWTTLLRVQYHKLRSYLYPLLVFLFILTNVFFVTVSKHLGPGVENEGSVASAVAAGSQGAFDPDGSVYNNWISLISDFCINTAPLLSWLGAFWMVGWSDERSTLIFFEQLSNLELYSRKTVRNYLVGAALAGIVLMATSNLTDVSGSGASTKQSFFQLVNTGLFVLLNYLITTFVICALASLICIFHYYSLSIFLEQLYSQDITVVEALREHTVLMRLQHESAKHVQYILFPPFILYVTGALLAAYNMLSLRVYTELSTTIFQLILAFVTLMIPLVSGAQITRVCGELARLATNLDLTTNLVERSALIQQLVLLPGNGFYIFGTLVNYGLLAKVAYALIAGIIVLARGASINTST